MEQLYLFRLEEVRKQKTAQEAPASYKDNSQQLSFFFVLKPTKQELELMHQGGKGLSALRIEQIQQWMHRQRDIRLAHLFERKIKGISSVTELKLKKCLEKYIKEGRNA